MDQTGPFLIEHQETWQVADESCSLYKFRGRV